MKNLVLITSVIKTPSAPLTTGIRSYYTWNERFEHTKKTIETVKEKVPDAEIMIVECSDLEGDMLEYLVQNCTYFLNLYHTPMRDNMFTQSKSLGEGTMTMCAYEYIRERGLSFDNFIKISGRYYLSEDFRYEEFDNECAVIHYIEGDVSNVLTALYKIPARCLEPWCIFLQNHYHLMVAAIGYEVLFAEFMKRVEGHVVVKPMSVIGVRGYVAVARDVLVVA